MLDNLKSFIKSKPRFYDFSRSIDPRRSNIRDFFDQYSKKHQKQINFIQLGANDGMRNDPIREFVVRDKWQGIFVEPLPSVFELLKTNYSYLQNSNLIYVNAAIGASNEKLSFWTFSDDFLDSVTYEEKLSYLRKSSFDKEYVLGHLKSFSEPEKFLKEVKVPFLSLDELVGQYWENKNIDLLVIDVEGYEATIIPSINYAKFSPQVIFFESHNLGEDRAKVFDCLESNGYKLTRLGGDTIAEKIPA